MFALSVRLSLSQFCLGADGGRYSTMRESLVVRTERDMPEKAHENS